MTTIALILYVISFGFITIEISNNGGFKDEN